MLCSIISTSIDRVKPIYINVNVASVIVAQGCKHLHTCKFNFFLGQNQCLEQLSSLFFPRICIQYVLYYIVDPGRLNKIILYYRTSTEYFFFCKQARTSVLKTRPQTPRLNLPCHFPISQQFINLLNYQVLQNHPRVIAVENHKVSTSFMKYTHILKPVSSINILSIIIQFYSCLSGTCVTVYV